MKKLLLTFGFIILFAGAFVFYNKLYYPSLPIQNISKKEAIDQARHSNQPIVKLAAEAGQDWYIINERSTLLADEIIIDMLSAQGWVLKQKEGSGLFFEKNDESLIVTTQKWTGKYTLVRVPVTNKP